MQNQDYKSCIEACLKCASLCNYCASSCLQEDDVKMMVPRIELDMECAVLCYAAVQIMNIHGESVKQLCKLCAEICTLCAEECAQHDYKHCKECAAACLHCAEECRAITLMGFTENV